MTNDARSGPSEEMTDVETEPTETSGDVTNAPAGEAPPPDEPAGEDPAPDENEPDLQRERDEYYDLLLRKTAEFDNYRNGVERERRELLERAGADVLEELLPILDDLERALEADVDGSTAATYRKGVEIIHGQLLELLRKHRVTPMTVVGADFDPHVHQAVAHEPSTSHRDGEVIQRTASRLQDRRPPAPPGHGEGGEA